jgi:scyllo-inositol 2-dehydrogenase (NADP+)
MPENGADESAAVKVRAGLGEIMSKENAVLHGAVIGYGGAFNMGRGHLEWMQAAGIKPTAACDIDPERMTTAKADFEGLRTYTSIKDLLADSEVNLVTVITPHNSHADIAVQAADAGKNVVVEKPMCITVAEADRMIDAAKRNNVTISVFHNRRYDGDFLAIKETIAKGLVGDVFQIQAGGGSFRHPGTWWRSNKSISGGLMYDWGAHFIDWILGLQAGKKLVHVTGFLQKKVWMDQTNEDHGQIIMGFDDGSVAELTQSSLQAVPQPRWRILGTKGGILDDGSVKDGFKLYTQIDDFVATAEIHNKKTEWNSYYKDLAAHFNEGKPSPVTAESARRIISVIEAAEESSRVHHSVAVKYA